jgi:DNA-binding XRE family transcriptional regulator
VVNRKRAIVYKDSNKAIAFGEHFKKVRKGKSITQTELAFEADVDRSTIVRLETGKFNPTIDLIFTLADALNIHVKELFDF